MTAMRAGEAKQSEKITKLYKMMDILFQYELFHIVSGNLQNIFEKPIILERRGPVCDSKPEEWGCVDTTNNKSKCTREVKDLGKFIECLKARLELFNGGFDDYYNGYYFTFEDLQKFIEDLEKQFISKDSFEEKAFREHPLYHPYGDDYIVKKLENHPPGTSIMMDDPESTGIGVAFVDVDKQVSFTRLTGESKESSPHKRVTLQDLKKDFESFCVSEQKSKLTLSFLERDIKFKIFEKLVFATDIQSSDINLYPFALTLLTGDELDSIEPDQIAFVSRSLIHGGGYQKELDNLLDSSSAGMTKSVRLPCSWDRAYEDVSILAYKITHPELFFKFLESRLALFFKDPHFKEMQQIVAKLKENYSNSFYRDDSPERKADVVPTAPLSVIPMMPQPLTVTPVSSQSDLLEGDLVSAAVAGEQKTETSVVKTVEAEISASTGSIGQLLGLNLAALSRKLREEEASVLDEEEDPRLEDPYAEDEELQAAEESSPEIHSDRAEEACPYTGMTTNMLSRLISKL